MRSRKVLLQKLIDTLVDEWGPEEVQDAVTRASSSRAPRQPALTKGQRVSPNPTPRSTAAELVEKASIQDSKREPILVLANKFDNKEFLPRISDVREFIILTGQRPRAIKDRVDAFPVLLKLLNQLPIEQLQRIARVPSHSGPTQLGPISDAIALVATQMPRRSETAGS